MTAGESDVLSTVVTPGRPVRIGISACLLGQEVRHDGGKQKLHGRVRAREKAALRRSLREQADAC